MEDSVFLKIKQYFEETSAINSNFDVFSFLNSKTDRSKSLFCLFYNELGRSTIKSSDYLSTLKEILYYANVLYVKQINEIRLYLDKEKGSAISQFLSIYSEYLENLRCSLLVDIKKIIRRLIYQLKSTLQKALYPPENTDDLIAKYDEVVSFICCNEIKELWVESKNEINSNFEMLGVYKI